MNGLCQCGCGRPAPISNENRPSRGLRKGEPKRYINGHASTPTAVLAKRYGVRPISITQARNGTKWRSIVDVPPVRGFRHVDVDEEAAR